MLSISDDSLLLKILFSKLDLSKVVSGTLLMYLLWISLEITNKGLMEADYLKSL